MDKDIISKNLIRFRKVKNMTQEQVSMILAVDTETVVAWEFGMETPTIAQIVKLAKFYNIDPTDLLEEPVKSVQVVQVSSHGKIKNSNDPQQPKVKFSKALVITMLVLASVFLVLNACPIACWEFYGYSGEILGLEILFGGNFALGNMLYWIINLISVWTIVDMIILLSAKNLRQNSFGYVSRILTFVFGLVNAGFMFLIFILLLSDISYLAFGFYLEAGIIIASLIISILYFKKTNIVEPDLTNQKPAKAHFSLAFTITMTVLSVVFILTLALNNCSIVYTRYMNGRFYENYEMALTGFEMLVDGTMEAFPICYWMMLLSQVWIFICGIIMLLSNTLRTNKFALVARIMNLVAGMIIAGAFIILAIYVAISSVYIKVGFVLHALIALATSIITITNFIKTKLETQVIIINN